MSDDSDIRDDDDDDDEIAARLDRIIVRFIDSIATVGQIAWRLQKRLDAVEARLDRLEARAGMLTPSTEGDG